MTATALFEDFQLNPKFSYVSPVHFDELDPMHMLHNSRFAAHVERAIVEFYRSVGKTWQRDSSANPDQFHVVRDFRIEFLAPVGPGEIEVQIWVDRIGSTSCTYGFRCLSKGGKIIHAQGSRTIVKVDPVTHQTVPWSDFFRAVHRDLVKDLPAMP